MEQVGEGGREGEEMGLPDDLLETSSSVGYSSDGEGEGEGEVPPPEGDQMDIDSAARHSGENFHFSCHFLNGGLFNNCRGSQLYSFVHHHVQM